MVSLWPWKGYDTSPASFEKTLSTLSAKITKATSTLDNRRQRLRRLKALWTLYSSFAYLLCFMILVFVVGWKNWSSIEYTTVAVGPAIIYLIKLGITTYYEYRISNLQHHVDSLQKQRDATIDKLKTATKYNTTQQLLEKYGGTPPTRAKVGSSNRKATPNQGNSNPPKMSRTGFVPPPTANIPGRNIVASLPSTPQRSTSSKSSVASTPPFSAAAASAPWQQNSPPISDTAEFAPNAFFTAPQYEMMEHGSRWYDRLMDVLLGEDETNPKNRLALICQKCRLVNGQAPPGVKQLEDIGKWRCSGCGVMNGEESEAKRIVQEIQKQSVSAGEKDPVKKEPNPSPGPKTLEDEVEMNTNSEHSESDVTQYSEDDVDKLRDVNEPSQIQPDPDVARPKRGRPKGGSKKKV